ncbi:Nephrocystin-3-like protein 2 [Paraphaeosphaeria minitans]|uniref:Nephrocystin-3-like protein 2 n=1 Tax=Paraphaeosphaeria minitans TaxID=565426 RepID=A0A9P6G6A1_9PLEO|nr:Nephrocystin-3-like protein 2 [Paraphaeosphaeria minitans]
MGIDAGFDMVPPLFKGGVDRHDWDHLIDFVRTRFKDDPQVEIKSNYIAFKAGEHPMLPFEGHKFLRFSSKVSGSTAAATGVEQYIDIVARLAKVRFGSRVQYWNEAWDRYGIYECDEVNESFRSYEQPDEIDITNTITSFLAGTDPIKQLDIRLFEVQNIERKERGLVARFNISTGTRILCEKPIFTARPTLPSEFESALAAKLKALPKDRQRQFLALHNKSPGKDPFTNTFKTTTRQFTRSARSNPGEEITISYFKEGRLVTEDDIGLKVLREAPVEAEATQIIDIVAIHGLGAHPDDSWCKNVGTRESPRWANWLEEESMLPVVAPNARIMRYGYQSQWFGKEAMQQSASTVADRLLRALKRKREDISSRPLLFVAHCFGGLVVVKALLEAEQYPSEWPGVFTSTTGLVFFGTPFRGAGGMNQMEMLEAARREYDNDQVQPTALEVLQPGNNYLQEVVDGFLKKMRGQTSKTQIACFYELKASDVGRIRFVVNESSGCLDLLEATSKYSLSRTHFDMNKFGKATEEDFQTVAEVIKGMVNKFPKLVWARAQYYGKHKVDFHLTGVPTVGKFIQRDAEMQKLEQLLLKNTGLVSRRRVVVLHGLGSIGKTQLVIEFARKHHHRFSSVFWLDGASEASLKQSWGEVLKLSTIDINMAVRECLRWLSLPTNQHWLIIFDNVDRDYHDKDDVQAFSVKTYFPSRDYGSILITSRLASLRRLGSGLKVETVETEQARAILESNAGRIFDDADIVLERLNGLPLALTQAGAYMQEKNVSALTYAKRYDSTWKGLMKREGQFPLEEYGDRNVLTTWIMSYEQVQKQSEEAAWLLKLWGYLDHGELWYDLVAAASRLSKDITIPTRLLSVADDELAYDDAVGLLSRFSLVDGREVSDSHSMHSVLHQWCGQLVEDKEQHIFGYIAAGIVALNVPSESEPDFWKRRKRLLGHAIRTSEWFIKTSFPKEEVTGVNIIQESTYFNLGYLLAEEDRQKAENMYQRALQGYEKAWGPEHTSTLDTVNNLGLLYAVLRRRDEAEKMYQRARL